MSFSLLTPRTTSGFLLFANCKDFFFPPAGELPLFPPDNMADFRCSTDVPHVLFLLASVLPSPRGARSPLSFKSKGVRFFSVVLVRFFLFRSASSLHARATAFALSGSPPPRSEKSLPRASFSLTQEKEHSFRQLNIGLRDPLPPLFFFPITNSPSPSSFVHGKQKRRVPTNFFPLRDQGVIFLSSLSGARLPIISVGARMETTYNLRRFSATLAISTKTG